MTRNRKRKQEARRLMESTGSCYLQANRELRSPRSPLGIPTPLPTLTEHIHGLMPGQLVAVASRPGGGKTLFAMSSVLSALAQRKSVLYFSLEQPEDELLGRIAPGFEGIPSASLALAQLTIDFNPRHTMESIQSRARELAATTRGLDLMILDYLDLIEPPQGEARRESRSAISRGFKALAQELQIPIIVLTRLHRTTEISSLASLWGSSMLAMDSDIVILLEKGTDDDLFRAKLAKNRYGASAKLIECERDQQGRLIERKARELSDNPILRSYGEALLSRELTLVELLDGWTTDGEGITEEQREEAKSELYDLEGFFGSLPAVSISQLTLSTVTRWLKLDPSKQPTVWELGEDGGYWFVEGTTDTEVALRALRLWLLETDPELSQQYSDFSATVRDDWYWEPRTMKDPQGESELRSVEKHGPSKSGASMSGVFIQA